MIRAVGSHFEVGRQIGAACAPALRRSIEITQQDFLNGQSWEDMRRQALPYLAVTEQALPWIATEIRGAAEGAGIDFLDLFVLACEELLHAPPIPEGRCTDFAVAPEISASGHVLLGHNNDLMSAAEPDVAIVEWAVEDQPRFISVGVAGLFISIGFNSAGISLTGNELHPNDERIGVPRLLMVREILAAGNFDEALKAALRADRASSYNNLIASDDGRIVNVEGSATDYALIPAQDGWTVHSNHYVSDKMQPYERYPQYTPYSVNRYRRACELMAQREGLVTDDMLCDFLTDHETEPRAICYHAGDRKTVFSALIDLNERRMDLALGNPCVAEFETYRLA
jgi:isopenicillin-N N-acyltransferase-like protein